MKRDFIPDHILERAVELWARKLMRPSFDNGDTSQAGAMVQMLNATNVAHDIDKMTEIGQRVAVFKSQLFQDLQYDRDHEGEETGEIRHAGHPGEYRVTRYMECCLNVDYGPCKALADAAGSAGIAHSLFSWKSQVWLNPTYVSTSFGYGAPTEYHHPLGDGRWLIAKLNGEDIPIILDAVRAGLLPEFTVEGP